jgi:predicted Fe-Mo cluster-binding NifX family protein
MKKVISAALAVLLLVAGFAFAGQKEKIAVVADGKTLDAKVSGQPGRSPFILFFDEKGKLIEVIANPAKDTPSAGIAVTDFLASKGVTIAVAGEYGPQIVEVMKRKGIKAIGLNGSVKEAVKNVLQSK